MVERPDVDAAVVRRVRDICTKLPGVREEEAWVGTRWCVGTKNFAHVVHVEAGWPPAYSKACGHDGPLDVVTLRSSGEELEALRHVGAPFFWPGWFPNLIGVVLSDDTDWSELGELILESWCVLAPKRVAGTLRRPVDGPRIVDG
ncbi:unnamed protein product [Phaeothamnion confervicola]